MFRSAGFRTKILSESNEYDAKIAALKAHARSLLSEEQRIEAELADLEAEREAFAACHAITGRKWRTKKIEKIDRSIVELRGQLRHLRSVRENEALSAKLERLFDKYRVPPEGRDEFRLWVREDLSNTMNQMWRR